MISVIAVVMLISGIAGAAYFFAEDQPIPGAMGLLLVVGCITFAFAGETDYDQHGLIYLTEKSSKACEKNGGLEKLKLVSGEIRSIKCKNGAKFNSKAVENL
jgi:hypothetical protein